MNLIDNARKASRKGQTVEFFGKREDGGYAFYVRDHGRGMTYTHPTNGKKVRGQKLGPAYDKPSLMKAFTTEKEAAYQARNQDDYEERHRKKDKLERVEEEMYRGWSL